MALTLILCVLFGYLLGCINPAYIIGRLHGVDLRKKGSQNAGASNALLLVGKLAAVFSAVFDIAKAALAFWLAPLLFKKLALAAEIARVCAILGHIFPFYMKFRGGKGTACLGGLLLAIDWRLLLILLAAEIVLVLITDYLCVMPITAAVAVPVLYGVLGDGGLGWLLNAKGGVGGVILLCVGMVAILLGNIKNIRRLVHGTELRFSYVFRKDREVEIARIRENQARWDREKEEKLARSAQEK